MKYPWLVVSLIAFIPVNASAQHQSPAVPFADFEKSTRDVAELFSWPALNLNADNADQDEEMRLWIGGGATLPGMVLRIIRITEDSAVAQVATWWQQGGFGDFIRQAIESDANRDCGNILSKKDVEGCIRSIPPDRNYSEILDGEYGDSLRSAVFDSGIREPSKADSVALAVEYRLGTRIGRAIPVEQDSLDPITIPAFCLFRKATDTGKPKVYADPFECR